MVRVSKLPAALRARDQALCKLLNMKEHRMTEVPLIRDLADAEDFAAKVRAGIAYLEAYLGAAERAAMPEPSAPPLSMLLAASRPTAIASAINSNRAKSPSTPSIEEAPILPLGSVEASAAFALPLHQLPPVNVPQTTAERKRTKTLYVLYPEAPQQAGPSQLPPAPQEPPRGPSDPEAPINVPEQDWQVPASVARYRSVPVRSQGYLPPRRPESFWDSKPAWRKQLNEEDAQMQDPPDAPRHAHAMRSIVFAELRAAVEANSTDAGTVPLQPNSAHDKSSNACAPLAPYRAAPDGLLGQNDCGPAFASPDPSQLPAPSSKLLERSTTSELTGSTPRLIDVSLGLEEVPC
ncbi:hypothetical protein WJX73_008627 [Symbiochloris irregularis]|uniref:Uncharacterized protein n=1 Tax=Symbiochloris irregularis TaxID=706552 RepID=A0AAW1NYN8_9CHLO